MLRLAFSLLTTLPLPAPAKWNPGDSGRAAGWYPLVGLVIGLLVAGVHWLAGLVLPPLVTGALALLAWAALTGGLHLDGLADCCDGLPYPGAPEKRLEIMRDPRLGAFGGIGLGLALLLKFSALASLTPAMLPGLLLAASLARWCILPAGLLPLAKPGGKVPAAPAGKVPAAPAGKVPAAPAGMGAAAPAGMGAAAPAGKVPAAPAGMGAAAPAGKVPAAPAGMGAAAPAGMGAAAPAGMGAAAPAGMGADFAAGLSKASLLWGGLIPLGLALALGWSGLLALALGLLAAFGVLTLAKNRLGGVTGDVFGLLVESVEIVVLLGYLSQ